MGWIPENYSIFGPIHLASVRNQTRTSSCRSAWRLIQSKILRVSGSTTEYSVSSSFFIKNSAFRFGKNISLPSSGRKSSTAARYSLRRSASGKCRVNFSKVSLVISLVPAQSREIEAAASPVAAAKSL